MFVFIQSSPQKYIQFENSEDKQHQYGYIQTDSLLQLQL